MDGSYFCSYLCPTCSYASKLVFLFLSYLSPTYNLLQPSFTFFNLPQTSPTLFNLLRPSPTFLNPPQTSPTLSNPLQPSPTFWEVFLEKLPFGSFRGLWDLVPRAFTSHCLGRLGDLRMAHSWCSQLRHAVGTGQGHTSPHRLTRERLPLPTASFTRKSPADPIKSLVNPSLTLAPLVVPGKSDFWIDE